MEQLKQKGDYDRLKTIVLKKCRKPEFLKTQVFSGVTPEFYKWPPSSGISKCCTAKNVLRAHLVMPPTHTAHEPRTRHNACHAEASRYSRKLGSSTSLDVIYKEMREVSNSTGDRQNLFLKCTDLSRQYFQVCCVTCEYVF